MRLVYLYWKLTQDSDTLARSTSEPLHSSPSSLGSGIMRRKGNSRYPGFSALEESWGT